MDNKIFIRERINIVDYDNNNQDIIYTSSDIDIEGGAVNVQLESDVGGWHQLTFDMPAFIIKDGQRIQNPLLEHLFPLARLQYTRVVKEKDEEKELILYFVIQPQDGTRDDNGIVLYNFNCIDYPRHYLSKAKNGITIGEDTIDKKRSMTPNNEIMNVDGKVVYVKAPVQSITFTNYSQLGAWGDAKPGAFAYISSTKKAYRLMGEDVADYDDTDSGRIWNNWYELKEGQTYTMDENIPVPDAVWCPDWGAYPLEPDVNNYDYGSIGINDIDPSIVQFYWDIYWKNTEKTIGRYDGLLYQEGSRLLYNVFKTLDYTFPDSFLGTYYKKEDIDNLVPSYIPGTTAYVIETGTVWRYNGDTWEDTYQNKREAFKTKPILKGDWSKLDPLKAYLAPNYAAQYLDYILEGTGWTVGEVDKIMVDTSTIEFGEDGIVHPKEQELTTFLYFDNSNAYNAITELCNSFKCYPRFDHVNKTVSLKAVPGLDYGLTYQWRENLANTRITQDGEKAVSKLWVYGGEDNLGEVTIADCNRMNPDYYLADYISLQDLKDRVQNPNEGQYGKVSTTYKWSQLVSQTLKNGQRLPITNTFNVGELRVTSWGTGSIPEIEDLSNLPTSGSLGQIVFVRSQNSYWAWFPEGNNWYDTFQETEPEDSNEIIKFEQRYDYINNDWVDKGQFYHWYEILSPFADNYILNFDYFLDRKLMTQEQLEDIEYNYILPISRLNRKRWPLYTEYQNLNSELLTWNATYDECKIARDAIDKSLRTTYAIYDTDSTGLITLRETDVSYYPPGADIAAQNSNKSSNGWVKADIVYSESDAPEVASYTAIATKFPKPAIGDYVKVKDEVQVYYYSQTFSYADTICAYLGWPTSASVDAQGPDKRKKELLFSPDGKTEARVRGEGLFQKFRDEELYPQTETDTSRAILAKWYNPPANINEVPAGAISDPTTSSVAHSYYDSQNRYVTEQINMNDALDRIASIETQLTILLEKIELLETQINKLEWALREKYGDFIVEGVFTDDTLVWKYNLWYAGLEALQLYHRPLVTYELDVVDVSGLPEYRTVTTDIYHDIVYRMNQAELVLPDPGDYCYVTDNTLGLVAERANITTVIRNLSNPSQHSITIETVDTNTEDLIGKVVTAANTIYSKQQIYNRSAIISADGTIAQDSLANSLDDNSGKLTLMSNNGTVILGENGITTVDRDDATARMQYTGKGIFASTDGGVTWENIVNAGKISIKNLSAGSIDSNIISVSNIGHDSSIIIDGKGISAINYSTSVSKTGTGTSMTANFDPTHTAFFLDASTGNAFFRGTIQAGAGDIAGWQIQPGKLYSGSGSNYVALSTSSKEAGADGTYAIWAGNSSSSNAPFSVTHTGVLKATQASITGAITANSLTLGSSVQIPENNMNVLNNYVKLNRTVSVGGSSFVVDSNGLLEAHNAVIYGTVYANAGKFVGRVEASEGFFKGQITADSGKIGGWTISNPNIQFGSTTILNGSTGQIKTSNLNATGGTIGGWIVNSSQIKSTSGKTILYSDGRINFENGSAYFRMGNGTNHPECSGLNVGSKGILFGSQAANTSITGDTSQMTITGATMTNIGINGTPKMLQLTTGSIITQSNLVIQGGITAGGKAGISRTKWKTEDALGTPWLTFQHGIIVDCSS